MSVVVYYWAGVPGHVAIEVDGGTPAGTMYLSRWPKTTATAMSLSWKGAGNQYSDDVTAEGGIPASVRFTSLNESDVKQAIIRANQWMIYNPFEANCSSHVKFCLDSGIAGPVFGLVTTVAGGWVPGHTPWGVYHYAQALHALHS